MIFGWSTYRNAWTKVTPELEQAMRSWNLAQFHRFRSAITKAWWRSFFKGHWILIALMIGGVIGLCFDAGQSAAVAVVVPGMSLTISLFNFMRAIMGDRSNLLQVYLRQTQQFKPKPTKSSGPEIEIPRIVAIIGKIYAVVGGVVGLFVFGFMIVIPVFAADSVEGSFFSKVIAALRGMLPAIGTFLAGGLCLAGKRSALYFLVLLIGFFVVLSVLAFSRGDMTGGWACLGVALVFFGPGILALRGNWHLLA